MPYSLPHLRWLLPALLPSLLAGPPAHGQQGGAPDSLRARLDSLLYRPLLVPLNAWQLPAPGLPAATDPAGNPDTNPAALVQARLPAYGRLGARGRADAGPWRRPQQARQELAGGFFTDGYRHRPGGWHAYGAAGYERQQATQVRWANNENPFDGNPYQWADTVGGTWQRDYLHARLDAARPLGAGFAAGLGLGYQAGQGARDSNPRPFFLSRVAQAVPGLWWQRGRHAAGLSARLRLTREQNESGEGADQFPLIYRLRGLGTFSAAPIVTGERQTDGRHWAAQGQYQYGGARGGQWLAEAGGGYRRAAVELNELRNSAQGVPLIVLLPGGTLRETAAHAQLATLQPAAWGRWLLRARYEALRRRGTDPLFAVVNTRDDQHHATVQARLLPGPAGQSAITLTLLGSQVQVQDLAARTRWLGRRAQGELTYERRWRTAGGWSGFVRPGIGYAPQLAASFVTGRPGRFVEALARPDYRAQTAAAAFASLGGAVEHWRPAGAVRLWWQAGYAHAPALDHRATGQAGVEWLF